MTFTKSGMLLFLNMVATSIFSTQSSPTNSSKNASDSDVEFSGWKPIVIPEALTTTEFAERLEVAKTVKAQNSSEMETADTKRSFILVYPPRASATDQEPQKEQPPQNTPRNHGLPLRSYPTQSRYHRMMNFGIPEGVRTQNKKPPTVHQRPNFPPVANPPPLPEHALRNRQRIPPNFNSEPTSQHQVQIQLLDGYIVPPAGGGSSNIHTEKKASQITTFPLNLNNVPEIRLLLPGDVHHQLNNLRQQPQQQQNRHTNAYTEAQNSDGRTNNAKRDFQNPLDKTNVYSFESQRRPGRTVEYSNTNRNIQNGRPQQPNFVQNQDHGKTNKNYSPHDPAIYPEAVNFPGQNNQNFQNTINSAVPYNHAKPYAGDVSSNGELPNRNRYPDDTKLDNRFLGNGKINDASVQNYGRQLNPVSQTKIHDATSGQGFPQNYGNQQNPVTDNRSPVSQTHIPDSINDQGIPQNYGNQGNPVTDNRTPISQTKLHDLANVQGLPQNYVSQENPVTDNRTPISQTKIHDLASGQGLPQNYGSQEIPVNNNRNAISHTKTHTLMQSFPQNYGGQLNPVSDTRTPVSQTKIHELGNDQNFPQNYGGQLNPVSDTRTPVSQTKIHELGNDQNFPQNYGGQLNPVSDTRTPVSQTKIHELGNDRNFPQNYGGQLNPVGDRRPQISQTHIHDLTNGQGTPQNYAGQQNPAFDNRMPIHSKTQGTVNAPNYSPNFVGRQNPTYDTRAPVHTKTQGTINVQSYSPNFVNQGNPSITDRIPTISNPQGYPNGQNFGIQQKYEPEDIQRGQIPIDTFQGTGYDDKRNFRPVSNNRNYNTQNGQNGNSYPSPQTYNRDGNINTYQRGKINNANNGRRPFQNGWRATPSNSGKQNFNPAGVPPSKINLHSGNSGNEDKNLQNGQQNGPSGTNFSHFGNGDEHQKSHGAAHSPSGTNFSHFGNGDEHQKSHGAAYSPSSSDSDNQNRPNHQKSHGSNYSPSSSDRDSQNRHTHQKSHGSNYSPSSSAQGTSEHDRSVPTQVLRGRRTSAEEALSKKPELNDRKVNPDGSIADDIYFVPPVLSPEAQMQIEPFGDKVSRDTVSTGIQTSSGIGRGDGSSANQKDISEYVSVDPAHSSGFGRQSEATFGRTDFCECTQSCAPVQRSPEENLGSSIREIARSLNADAFFEFVGLTDEEIENILASDGSYTFFIPSNEAVSRLPSNLIDHWRESNPDLRLALLNHVVRDKISLDQLKLGGRMTSRANDATVFINNYNNEAVTINGHRIAYGDISAPRGGIIHVIDGTLCPIADQDIINTLRTCNKYDGFLTLADVTKLLDTMQDEGPYTVFLPSNEALTKIPADELAVLKENSTVLREFLEYHIVQGAYFSGDLKDGQYLTTLHQRQPVRMGVRVDGCYRRLVEANNSPLFKSDIPTKNGVIHVVDWILRPSDLQWCDGVILP